MIDTNAYLSRWPFRRLPLDETAELVARLRGLGVGQAWVASFDGLLHRDVAGVNRRLVEECRRVDAPLLLPIGTVNPALPDWQDDLRRCAQEHHMRGIRLHPNYHGYSLADERMGELLALAHDAGLIVQIAVRMEDVRTQHPLLQVADVDVQPLAQWLDASPAVQVVLLNALNVVRGAVLEELVRRPNVSFEIAMLEGVGGIERIIRQIPYERLLYGSYAPFFVPESARGKLDESELGATIRASIETENARRLLNRSESR